jgi:hypothetical protein
LYVVAATVIPVLFLAIAVQGNQQAEDFDTTVRKSKWGLGEQEKFDSTITWGCIWLVFTILTLMWGIFAEIAAVLCLWFQNNQGFEPWTVPGALIGLTAIAGINAMSQWMKPIGEVLGRPIDRGDAESASGEADPVEDAGA